MGSFLNIKQNAINSIPINMRQYASSLLGDRSVTTEKNLSKNDLQVLRDAVSRQQSPNGSIGYGDYDKNGDFSKFEGGSKTGVDFVGSVVESFKDPKFRMETFLGMADYNTDKDGNVIVTDTYDFNAPSKKIVDNKIKESGGEVGAFMKAYKDSGYEGLINAVGNRYIGTEGTGSKIKINLGKIRK